MDIGQLISDLLRSISFFLDKLVYGFVGTIYNLLVEIAQTSIFTDEVIDIFAGKIYALLGIFMLFKVSFSILTYIVSPDDFIDKNKGFSKLISNILITLTLLVITPWLFTQAMDVQRIILRDNVIGKIFINTGNGVNMPTMSDPGNLMAYQTYKAFFHVDTSLYPNCVFDKDGELNSECRTDIGDTAFDSAEDTLKYSEQTNSVSIYMDDVLLNLKSDNGNKDYVMVYFPFISVIVGIVLLLLLIVFCFDIAVRSIKLGFLRMLAPIPIVSRIDPKKGKEVFDKWFKMVLSTYLDLFIRLIAIYFAVFVISLITQNFGAVDAVTGLRKSVNPFVIVFIILGSLLFAKQLPKLIEDLTGFKMDGKLTLNPLKKLGEVPLAGKAAATVGGVVAGAKAGSHVGAMGKGAFLGALSGARSVPLSGTKNGESAFFKGANTAYKGLLGKDFVTFGAANFIPESSKKRAVDEVGAPLKNAYAKLASLNTELNSRAHTTATQAQSLLQEGVDIYNADKEPGAYLKASSEIRGYQSAIAKEKDAKVKAQLQAKLNFATQDFQTRFSTFETTEIGAKIKAYDGSIASEEALRGAIAGVEKDIKDLSKEKGAREQFYRYDPSPEADVRKLVDKYGNGQGI